MKDLTDYTYRPLLVTYVSCAHHWLHLSRMTYPYLVTCIPHDLSLVTCILYDPYWLHVIHINYHTLGNKHVTFATYKR